MPEFFGPLFRSAFLVNKKSLFLQKCQCIELYTAIVCPSEELSMYWKSCAILPKLFFGHKCQPSNGWIGVNLNIISLLQFRQVCEEKGCSKVSWACMFEVFFFMNEKHASCTVSESLVKTAVILIKFEAESRAIVNFTNFRTFLLNLRTFFVDFRRDRRLRASSEIFKACFRTLMLYSCTWSLIS